MTKDVKALWRKICDTILPQNPDWIKLLLDWKDAEQEELKAALSACQLQNETNQAAHERSRASDAAQLRATGKMQESRDALLAALVEIRDGLLEARKHYGCTSRHCSGTCHFCAGIRRCQAAITLSGIDVSRISTWGNTVRMPAVVKTT